MTTRDDETEHEYEETSEEETSEGEESSGGHSPSADQKKIASMNFERARQVIATEDYDFAINLLKTCCKLDPGNFQYRQLLRRTQKDKYGNNLRGSRFAFFSTPSLKTKMKASKASANYAKVLELGEEVLSKNPWDLGAQMDMAEAFDALGFLDLAVFSLDQARQKYAEDSTLNRALARLFEKRGDFSKAILLWQKVQQSNPKDIEAAHKAKDLAASETIARGGYGKVAASGKESDSPLAARLESQGAEKQDRLSRDTTPILKRIEADPTEPSLYVQLANLYRRHAQDDRARAVLQQGLGPTGNHFSLTLELQEMELAPFRKAVEQLDTQLRLAKSGNAAEAGATVEELTRKRAKLAKEILAREVAIYREKADRFVTDVTLRLELGARLLKMEKYDEAIVELQQAKREEKCRGRASMYLGMCFRAKNNWRLASRNWDDALATLNANDEAARKEILFQLASGCAENDEVARAIDLGHELANLDYGYKNIGDLIEQWREKA